MKQLVWSPSSINFGSVKKGESVTAESTLSITEGSALLTPGKISPLPGADYQVQIKNTEGNLHIHPAFSFAAARYYLTSAGTLTTDRDIAEIYLGNAGAGSGLPFLPVPITLAITTSPGDIDPADPLTINYTSSAVLWVKVFFKVNDSEWFFYDTFNATGTFDMDISELGFSHGDILTIKVQDDESTSFYDTVAFDVMVKNIVIDSIGTIYLIGEFENGVDYYATPEGEITTEITGIYLGVGNADGDIDLDIIEYAVEITSPLDSADIALDVPFTFEATTNVQDDRTLHIVAYQGELSVILDELTISGGAITGSVTVSESDGFTTGAVQLLAWYSPVVSTIKTVDVTAHTATITNVTSTPASPEPATNFELSGESTYLVGKELTLQYSTDDSTWLPLGVATVQHDGTWSKADCQIATAGTYYLRAIYGDEVVESASISVVVASGVVALQFGSNGEDWLTDIIEDGDNLIVAGITSGTTMFGASTGSANRFMGFLNKIDKDGNTVAGFTPRFWVSQSAATTLSTIQSRQITVMGDYIYNIRTSTSGNIEKRSKSTGALISDAYLKVEGQRYSITNDGTHIYVCGNDIIDVYNPASIFKLTDALAVTQYKNQAWRSYYDLDFNGTDFIVSQNGSNHIRRVDTSGTVQATTAIAYSSDMHRHITATANRSYTFNKSADGWGIHAMSNSTLAKLFVVDVGFASYPACCRKQSNGDIGFVCRNATDELTAIFFSDADAYSEVARKVITAYSGTIRLTTSHCPIISEGGYVGGSIDGKITEDATQVSGHDCFIVKAR